jgi:hypothetical protein
VRAVQGSWHCSPQPARIAGKLLLLLWRAGPQKTDGRPIGKHSITRVSYQELAITVETC